MNVSVTGNTFRIGGGDGESLNKGLAPNYAIALKHLCGAVIANNAVHCGGLEQCILDLGEHEDEVLVSNNVGKASKETAGMLPKLEK